MESVERNMEIKCVVALLHCVDKVIELHESPLVQLCELVVAYAVLVGIEACAVAKVAQNETSSISYLLVSVGKLTENWL